MQKLAFDGCSLTLYVATGTPSASVAIANLSEALATLGASMEAVRLVDVFSEPRDVLEAGVIATPALSIARTDHIQWFLGDFREQTRLRAWFQSILEVERSA